jgi:hypothetical protein
LNLYAFQIGKEVYIYFNLDTTPSSSIFKFVPLNVGNGVVSGVAIVVVPVAKAGVTVVEEGITVADESVTVVMEGVTVAEENVAPLSAIKLRTSFI